MKAIGLVLLLCGCELVTDSFVTNDFSGDPYPIGVQRESGAVLVGMRASDGTFDRTAVLDVLSPITVVDPGFGVQPSVSSASLSVLGVRPGSGDLDLPRAVLPEKRVISLHPCQDTSCFIGPGGQLRAADAIIGADALAGDAVRFDLANDRVFILPDIAGDDRSRSFACDAVFPAPYRGGGTLVIAGAEIGFGGRRITMQACLHHDTNPNLVQAARGADVLFVVSTGVGRTILGESAYERYRRVDPAAPALDALPPALTFLVSGELEGKLATIDRMALVAASTTSPRAPCRQVYAHDLLLDRNCGSFDDCPCDGAKFCATPAHVALTPTAGIEVLVVPDASPTLQALRAELRPDQAEVDGILGADALVGAELDVDYPHNRVLARCNSATCVAHPALSETADRDNVTSCIVP